MNYVLDTNVISELIARSPNQQVIDWLDRLDPDVVYLSVITIGELRKGIEKLVLDFCRFAPMRGTAYDLVGSGVDSGRV